MNLLSLLILLISSLIIFFILRYRIPLFSKHKYFNINLWMSMSGNDRNLYDQNEKLKRMERKKLLLKDIRKEYQEVLKRNK